MRTLQLPTISDRIMGRAVVQAVEAYLDATFEESSYGFRPGSSRSRLQALATAEALAIREDAWRWLTVDIRDAFGSVPRSRLLDILRPRLTPAAQTSQAGSSE